jgi:hypothetical protein
LRLTGAIDLILDSLHHLIEAYALSETIARLNFPSAAINHPVVKLHAP